MRNLSVSSYFEFSYRVLSGLAVSSRDEKMGPLSIKSGQFYMPNGAFNVLEWFILIEKKNHKEFE